ncbi:hypothetical protein DPEC_G00314620 [Dallia pectoralis]|uniref:Uncharacterized protein n=1 Tax=Dallia pectoralis TaxID=75939 RepID=A0ACC2FCD9_DALPE|nr:hypothetical protein DPEC_G00314620 [Dallia pectoralis]
MMLQRECLLNEEASVSQLSTRFYLSHVPLSIMNRKCSRKTLSPAYLTTDASNGVILVYILYIPIYIYIYMYVFIIGIHLPFVLCLCQRNKCIIGLAAHFDLGIDSQPRLAVFPAVAVCMFLY